VKSTNSQRYLLADDFDEKSKDLSMRRSAWTIISGISQLKVGGSFQDFCSGLSLSENEAQSVIRELVKNKLIYESSFPNGTPSAPTKSVRDLLAGTFSTLAKGVCGDEVTAGSTETVSDSTTEIKIRLGEFPRIEDSKSIIRSWIWESSDRSSPSSVVGLEKKDCSVSSSESNTSSMTGNDGISRSVSSTQAASRKKNAIRKFKLQPIISQIEKLSSGGVEGSVLVYQVFLKVPSELLQNEGIESLKLVDANTEFTSQKLCQAIIRATTQITGYNLKIVGYNN
jgi:hypothetical protein